jgi:hypothetical protein
MMGSENKFLADSYLEWLKANITVKEINGFAEITTPFLDRYNDHLQIYVKSLENDKLLLTDDGYILNELSISGLDLKYSPKKQRILNTILNGYGVQKSPDGELFIEATRGNFPQKKHALLQAMMTTDDMFMIVKENITNLFFEDVEKFLKHNEIRYTRDVQFVGTSRFTHKFDFVIPASKSSTERILKTINNPTKDKITGLIFNWNDTLQVRNERSVLYTVLNDSDKKVNPDLISALTQYDVKAFEWSKREEFVEELAV